MKGFKSTEMPGRRRARVVPVWAAVFTGLAASFPHANAGARVIPVSLDWSDIASVSKTAVTIEVCVEPPLRRGHPIHDKLFAALHDLGAEYAHLQPYNIFPRLAVAELEPPVGGKTSWDFSAIDPIVADFMRATAGHPVVFNFGTLPAWIFQTQQPAAVPRDPDQVTWTYSEFNKAQVTAEAVRRAAAYQARLASWYVTGGFTDELGHWHSSGHHYHIDYWEVLNDPDFEDSLGPAEYTRLYDAIVSAVRRAAPGMKFMGPAVGDVAHAQFLAYFLNPAHHEPGIPIDMLSYHFFLIPDSDEPASVMPYTLFHEADGYLLSADYIETLRREFVPGAKTDVDDIATMLPDPLAPKLAHPIPGSYWSLSGGVFAYLYGKLALLGVNAVGASELIDSPGIVAASTLVDWDTGRPNARYWVLKLLRENFGPGDRLVRPQPYTVLQPDPTPQVYVQGFVTAQGVRKILLVNKRAADEQLRIAGAAGGTVQTVDEYTTASSSPRRLEADLLNLPALAVAVVTLGR
ncbi:MAG: hypothetical protein ACREFT_04810 [Acetobacteraceae bacterium]